MVEILSEGEEVPEVLQIMTDTSITYEQRRKKRTDEGGSQPSVSRAATSTIDVTVGPVVHLHDPQATQLPLNRQLFHFRTGMSHIFYPRLTQRLLM